MDSDLVDLATFGEGWKLRVRTVGAKDIAGRDNLLMSLGPRLPPIGGPYEREGATDPVTLVQGRCPNINPGGPDSPRT